MSQQIITLIGGTGFLGRYVVRELAKAGYRLRVISRSASSAIHLKTAGDVGQIALISGNITQPETIAPYLEDSFAVVNMVGVLFERGSQNFAGLHARGAEKLAQMAARAKVRRFVHISALAVDKVGDSQYARSKHAGEEAVRAAFPSATILRPSVMFGAEDDFFNKFAAMAALSPVLPLIGGGHTRFQPVYVDDVAMAVAECLANEGTQGKTYELGGPRVMSFRDVLEYVMATTGHKRRLCEISFRMARMMGAFSEWLPRPPLTRDQVALLKHDNVVSPGALMFEHLGIRATAVETIAPGYLKKS